MILFALLLNLAWMCWVFIAIGDIRDSVNAIRATIAERENP